MGIFRRILRLPLVVNSSQHSAEVQTPQARQFKTLSAAYSYLRTYVEYRGDVSIRLLEHKAETDDA
jgi:hypothetical protein